MQKRLFVFAVIVTLSISTAYSAGATDKALSFGVVPQQAASKLATQWVPILEYLGEKSGYRLEFATAPDIPTFEKRVLSGEYDFAYMNPYHYTVFHNKPGYEAIAKQKDKRIVGLIVVRTDSELADISQLAGKTLAFPAPAAFAASVLPMANLRNSGIDFTPQFVSSHDSVYQAVALGLYPAGGGIERTLDSVPQIIRNQLKVLWRTDAFTPHAFAVHPRVRSDITEKLIKAMLAMGSDPDGQERLRAIQFTGIEPAQNSDWDDVRALKIDQLKVE